MCRRNDDKTGRVNSVFLYEGGDVYINVVWDDRSSGTYDPEDIVLEDWVED